jgi:hypothetical protein
MDRSQEARSTLLRTDSTGSLPPKTCGVSIREHVSGLANGRGRSESKSSCSEGRSIVLPSWFGVAGDLPVAPPSGISFPLFLSFRSFLGFSCEDEVGASSSESVVRDGASEDGREDGESRTEYARECPGSHRVVDARTASVTARGREREDGVRTGGGTTVS